MTAINALDAPNRAALLAAILDENGNLDANVTVRTNTLAALLAVVDAGDGEIAVCSDIDAMVVYKGNPALPVVYRKTGIDFAMFRTGSSPGSLVVPTSVGAIYQSTTLILPTYGAKLDISVSFQISALTANWWYCVPQIWDGVSVMVAGPGAYHPTPTHGQGQETVSFNFPGVNYNAPSSGVPKLALSVWHDGPSSITASSFYVSILGRAT